MANRSKLSTTELDIKPQMSRAEREIESLLLKERRKLINSNTPSQHIRICNNHLLIISGQIHAQVSVVDNQCHLEYLVQGEVIPNAVSNPNPALSQTSPIAEIRPTVNPTNNLHTNTKTPSSPATSTQEINPPTSAQEINRPTQSQ